MIILKAEIKYLNGKRNNKRIRKLGYIPSIIYNKHISTISIKFKERLFKSIINLNNFSKNIIIKINLVEFYVKIKNIQYHPFKNKIIHVDFIKI